MKLTRRGFLAMFSAVMGAAALPIKGLLHPIAEVAASPFRLMYRKNDGPWRAAATEVSGAGYARAEHAAFSPATADWGRVDFAQIYDAAHDGKAITDIIPLNGDDIEIEFKLNDLPDDFEVGCRVQFMLEEVDR